MIDKQEYYHGVAIIRLLDDSRCHSVTKHDFGYLVNEDKFIFLRYSTKARSPWRFSFSKNEIAQINHLSQTYSKIIVVLICGGDGICAVDWEDSKLIVGEISSWIAIRRNFNKCYGVSGPLGKLKKKVSLQKWPLILFEDFQEIQS